jgi:hypothetical protein
LFIVGGATVSALIVVGVLRVGVRSDSGEASNGLPYYPTTAYCLDPALDAGVRDAIRAEITNAMLVEDDRCEREALVGRPDYNPRQPVFNPGIRRIRAEDGHQLPERFYAVRALTALPEDSEVAQFLPFTDYVVDAAYYCEADLCLGVGWEVYVAPGEETSKIIRRIRDALDDAPPDVLEDSPEGQPPVSRPERPLF